MRLYDKLFTFSCHAVSTVHSPCRKNPMLFQQARATCFYLLNKNKFGSCHNVVPPNSFISSCMMDICSTSIQVFATSMIKCKNLSKGKVFELFWFSNPIYSNLKNFRFLTFIFLQCLIICLPYLSCLIESCIFLLLKTIS